MIVATLFLIISEGSFHVTSCRWDNTRPQQFLARVLSSHALLCYVLSKLGQIRVGQTNSCPISSRNLQILPVGAGGVVK